MSRNYVTLDGNRENRRWWLVSWDSFLIHIIGNRETMFFSRRPFSLWKWNNLHSGCWHGWRKMASQATFTRKTLKLKANYKKMIYLYGLPWPMSKKSLLLTQIEYANILVKVQPMLKETSLIKSSIRNGISQIIRRYK